jgi:hypothetical protein
MKNTLLFSLLLGLSVSGASSSVIAAPISGYLSIDSGFASGTDADGNEIYGGGSYFKFGQPQIVGNIFSSAYSLLSPGTDPGLAVGLNSYQPFVLDPDTPHPQGWDNGQPGGGSAGAGYGVTPVSGGGLGIEAFAFGSANVYIGTNPVSYQSGLSFPAPTGDISNCMNNVCTLSLELSSFEVEWNGTAFQQGPRPNNTQPFVMATGTFDQSTNHYDVTWSSQILGGPFNNVTASWHLEGTVMPVPEPSAAGMMAAGLVLLGMAARLRKRA